MGLPCRRQLLEELARGALEEQRGIHALRGLSLNSALQRADDRRPGSNLAAGTLIPWRKI